MEHKISEERIDSVYVTLSDAQKNEYKLKQERLDKIALIVGIILLPFLIAVLVFCFVMAIPEKMYGLLIFVIIFEAIIGALDGWLIKTGINGKKCSEEKKIKKYIKRLEEQKEFKKELEEKKQHRELLKNVYYRLDFNNILRVTILDSYTEMSDKLHAFLNYQEIIQTRVYKFKVDYKDGTSNILTATENSEEYNVLMPLVNKVGNTPTTISLEKSNIEKIREYKQLLDDGIITEEEFEKKKKELL